MLKARVLTAQERHAEAETMLTQAVDADPRNPDLLAQLGETKLLLAKYPEAQQLVDKVLRVRPHYGRALYVRARSLEAQGRIKDAEESYRYALTAEPGFAPVLSRMWRLDVKAGRKEQAVEALEQLFFMGEASADEKVALAELYAGSKSQLERARKLIDEALARDPKNERFLAIRASIEKATVKPAPKPKGPTGPVIIRGGR
jgi:tetratricopeptide (TPR) repeat protein